MNVSVTKHQEKFIGQEVKSGRYQTASEVVRDALRLLEERRQQVAALRADIRHGLESGSEPLDMAEIKQEVHARMRGRSRKQA